MKNLMWRAYLTRTTLKAHEKWARAGQQGSGRLVLEGKDLRDAVLPGPHLVAAQLVRCDARKANMRVGNLTSIELIDCTWDGAMLEMTRLNKAVIENCRFVGAYMNVGHFIGAQVRGGDWSQVDLHNSTWTNAQMVDVCFQDARFQGAKLYGARLIGCNLMRANVAAMTPYDAVFERCDFRYCNLNYLKLKNTVFYKCGFYGCTGTPTMEGACEVIEPDLSEAFDGSGVVDAAHLFQRWGLSTNA